MADAPYDDLAAVYDWFVPESLLAPRGSAAGLGVVTDALASGAAGTSAARSTARRAG